MPVVCCSVSYIITNVTMVPTFVSLEAASGQHDVVLLLPMIQMDKIRGAFGVMTLHSSKPQSQMPPQVYTNYAMGPLHEFSSFRVEPPNDFLILVPLMVFAPCFKIPM